MPSPNGELKRREFLKSGVVLGGATTAMSGGIFSSQACAADKGKAADQATAMPVKAFGKTGWKMPVLGMGGSAMIKQWNKEYGVGVLPLEDRVAMVRYAYDRGVRYFDTARVYAESESIMGQGLKGVRENVYLATKIADPRPTHTRASLEKSLKELQTDYVDCAQIHSPAIEKAGFAGAMKIHEQLLKLKDEGLVRFIGLTTHVAFEEVAKLVATGGFDQVLLAYAYFNRGLDTMLSHRNLQHRAVCLAKAHELGMGIVSMKVMGAGVFSHNSGNVVPGFAANRLPQLPGAAIRWVLNDERISMLNIGISIPQDIDDNIAVLSENLKLTNKDRRLLAEFSGEAYEAKPFSEMKTV
ncbi:General stress protein 69 [Symmachiella macrocystis]|uniref:General stress protein 69 n=1 Tax=Symmachiella macrocystis TaxID=2527985 RepID=A0A5C6BQ69_9PLAN|nr:aldo/keto reductase [Symmachiella macrocystis]TWU14208.1 General stress protein 69 [Symmachiella macrocystis]